MVFPKKHSLVFNMDKEEDAALYKHWTEIYENILIDITDNIEKYKQGGDLK